MLDIMLKVAEVEQKLQEEMQAVAVCVALLSVNVASIYWMIEKRKGLSRGRSRFEGRVIERKA